MSKTVKEWFESVENDELRNALLSNMGAADGNVLEPTLEQAIGGGFIWHNATVVSPLFPNDEIEASWSKTQDLVIEGKIKLKTTTQKSLKRSDLVELVVRGMRMGRNISSFEGEEWKVKARTLIDAYLNPDPTKPFWQDEIESHVTAGNMLRAVKTLKDYTDVGLRDAKDAVDYYKANGYWNINELGIIIR